MRHKLPFRLYRRASIYDLIRVSRLGANPRNVGGRVYCLKHFYLVPLPMIEICKTGIFLIIS